MTETIRIENAINEVEQLLNQGGEYTKSDIVKELPHLRDGDIRAAMWQLVDGGFAQFNCIQYYPTTISKI